MMLVNMYDAFYLIINLNHHRSAQVKIEQILLLTIFNQIFQNFLFLFSYFSSLLLKAILFYLEKYHNCFEVENKQFFIKFSIVHVIAQFIWFFIVEDRWFDYILILFSQKLLMTCLFILNCFLLLKTTWSSIG